MKSLGKTIRNRPPGEGWTKIDSKLDGLPEGVHTGGCWLDPQGVNVWKPLDGGSPGGEHYPTLEAECLEDMAGQVGFPRNWWIENRNGRRWLVRPKCPVWGQDSFPSSMEIGTFVEEAIRNLNRQGWEIGDRICVAFDIDVYQWFILDLSCARRTYQLSTMWDDEWRVWSWWESNRFDRLHKLRSKAREIISDLWIKDSHGLGPDDQWVYASIYRPLSMTWAHRIRDKGHLVHAENYQGVMSWFVTSAELDPDIVKDYELTLAWWPWETAARIKEMEGSDAG